MKLGIVVVYLLSKQQAPLLGLHLGHIKRFTSVPYTIYAAANRLEPEFIPQLADDPNVKICNIPPTELVGAVEHEYYLEALTKAAVDDGASHILVMHVDSFPVKNGWAEKLIAKLDEKTVCLVAETFYTACMLFTSEFYKKYQPRYRSAQAEQETSLFKEFMEKQNPIQHAGIGYLFRAYQNNLTVEILANTVDKEDLALGFDFYDRRIFHVVGSARLAKHEQPAATKQNSPLLEILRFFRNLLPSGTRFFLIKALMNFVPENRRESFNNLIHTPKLKMIEQFFANPEHYLQRYYDRPD